MGDRRSAVYVCLTVGVVIRAGGETGHRGALQQPAGGGCGEDQEAAQGVAAAAGGAL